MHVSFHLPLRFHWAFSPRIGLPDRVPRVDQLAGCGSKKKPHFLLNSCILFFSLLLTLVRRLTGSPSGLTEAGCGSKKKASWEGVGDLFLLLGALQGPLFGALQGPKTGLGDICLFCFVLGALQGPPKDSF